MDVSYKINEVAERSGFTPATLRYYEQIGLLPEPARTGAGYRLYDVEVLERLAFIARAKQLGCTLEETGALVRVRDAGRCGPVQHHLRELVAAKVAAAEAQIAALTTLTAELHQALEVLDGSRPDAPCDEHCRCGPVSIVRLGRRS